jgi:Putative zinc-finger
MNQWRPTGPIQQRIEQLLTTARQARHDLVREDPPGVGPPPHPSGDQLFAYWENTLDEPDRVDLEEHVACCDECMRWLFEVGKLFPPQ